MAEEESDILWRTVDQTRFTTSLRTYTDLDGVRWHIMNLKSNIMKAVKNAFYQQLKDLSKQEIIWKLVKPKLLEKVEKIIVDNFCNAAESCALRTHDIQEIVDNPPLLMLKLLCSEEKVTENHIRIIHMKLGQFNSLLFVNNCLQAIKEIRSKVDIANILKSHDNYEASMFGMEIPYHIVSKLDKIKNSKIDLLLDLEKVDTNKTSNIDVSLLFPPKSNVTKEEKVTLPEQFGLMWLINRIKSNMTNIDAVECAESIIQKLKLNNSVGTQNELVDMLGFDSFELILELLTNRETIIEKCSRDIENGDLPSGSSDSCFFERNLLLASQENQILGDGIKNKDMTPQFKTNDQVIQTSLESTLQPKKYPYVWDMQSETKNIPTIIGNRTLELPENAIKKCTFLAEEVTIPMVPQHPPLDLERTVKITELNPIGQKVFEGVKKLNRIQSIVFDSAYNSNENLLICAPTGAGKTNIALLGVAREIEQRTEDSVLQKDAFKIVYVAPMKALATEMTENFSKRLNPLGLKVKEFTGDMNLTKAEITDTHMLITTPEKWDVITRKGTGGVSIITSVKLLIIDEVHLLHGDRGPVVEALVARTLRQVESSQSMIRIIGLSATLPNYLDVARFLRVNPEKGLFFFDSRFRPVPLEQTFVGVIATKPAKQNKDMDYICYEKMVEDIQQGYQVMVFVHARNSTLRVARTLRDLASTQDTLSLLQPSDPELVKTMTKVQMKLKNKQVAELLPSGISCHHAGLLRGDRNLIEKNFSNGLIKVLVCTSTLAWGVNLPAHTVIIRGTEIYDSKKGKWVDIGILDVLQIFGRAGRPQYEASGHGIIITTRNRLDKYLSLIMAQTPIESNFINFLTENLNAEIVLGTISNVNDAIKWLSYTYLILRMKMNPMAYGMTYAEVLEDPTLLQKRLHLIRTTAKLLDGANMIRYNERTGDLNMTDLGRIASHFYVKYGTVEVFNKHMKSAMNLPEILGLISKATEFEQLKARQDELEELDELADSHCKVHITSEDSVERKVNILLQTYLSMGSIESFSLVTDQCYIMQNAVRIARALFEISLSTRNALMAWRYLLATKMLELRMWDSASPLQQFGIFGRNVLEKIENKNLTVERIREMTPKEVGGILNNPRLGTTVYECANQIPSLTVDVKVHPITRTVLRIMIKLKADFQWSDRVHGKSPVAFWVWIEEPDSYFMYHSELFLLTRHQVMKKEEQEMVVMIPVSEPPPAQYYVRVVSDSWMGGDVTEPFSFAHLTLPDSYPSHTDLLPLEPLPVSALDDPDFEGLYNFSHFNAIQTQIFHCLYHTDKNVLLGAPTGSGKTMAAEIAILRAFKKHPGTKVVYIAPLKALVRERVRDWKMTLGSRLGKNIVELTGDVSPDIRAICDGNVIVTTPEKWDGISRSWQTRNYVQDVSLIVIDEIHLLGEDRGPVLEVIVSRTNFITYFTSRRVRIIGLSTALANAKDLADWLGIGEMGLYNFRPSVRPVPIEVHVAGFSGKHYCPRMATMNRPTFRAIRQHSPCKPALVFVSSRRQTRLTALDLLAYLAGEDDPMQWLHMSIENMNEIINTVKDSNLKLTLAFGIGLHHAGLVENDRKIVENLFETQKIQILIATATLAWGVNFPAHLVVIKGTEYYDGKTKKYVDMPLTDVLQMIGRAGRPQFDEQGVAVVLVHDAKKNFYKKFLYEPFPVESSLVNVLPDHLNAEVVAGTIQTKQEALDYLTWTFFFRRLLKNPSYYNLEGSVEENINAYLTGLVEKAFADLEDSNCIEIEEDQRGVVSTANGRIASFYYISHLTMRNFRDSLRNDITLEQVIDVLSNSTEYSQLPVRHNEDSMNGELAKKCPLPVNQYALDLPSTKVQLLLQAHFSRLSMPCADYLTDLKSVLEQAIRILQAMVDFCAEQGWLIATLRIQQLMQMVIQASWIQSSPLLTLPHVEEGHLSLFSTRRREFLYSLPSLASAHANNSKLLRKMLESEFSDAKILDISKTLSQYPNMSVSLAVRGENSEEMVVSLPANKDTWLSLKPDQEYTLKVTLKRPAPKHTSFTRTHAPRFPRPVDEGWFLTLGCIERKELIALKRAATLRPPSRSESVHSLTFYTPETPGRHVYTLYILSDCYIGFDQQYSFNLEIEG